MVKQFCLWYDIDVLMLPIMYALSDRGRGSLMPPRPGAMERRADTETRLLPEVGARVVAIMRRVVVFPQPGPPVRIENFSDIIPAMAFDCCVLKVNLRFLQ